MKIKMYILSIFALVVLLVPVNGQTTMEKENYVFVCSYVSQEGNLYYNLKNYSFNLEAYFDSKDYDQCPNAFNLNYELDEQHDDVCFYQTPPTAKFQDSDTALLNQEENECPESILVQFMQDNQLRKVSVPQTWMLIKGPKSITYNVDKEEIPVESIKFTVNKDVVLHDAGIHTTLMR